MALPRDAEQNKNTSERDPPQLTLASVYYFIDTTRLSDICYIFFISNLVLWVSYVIHKA